MEKILVANPPAYFEKYPDRHFIQAGSRWSFSMDAPKGNHKFPHYQPYPFKLAYLVSSFSKQRVVVEGMDGCALDMDEKEWFDAIIEFEPDRLLVEVPTISFPLVKKLLWKIKSELDIPISIGGPHVIARPKDAREFTVEGRWGFQKDFKNYPYPDREFFPNERYSNFEFYRPSAQMLSSIGCKGNCTFCIERHVIYNDNCIRMRSPIDVVDEMEELASTGVRQVWFDDMSFTNVKEHVEGICLEIMRRGIDMPWTAMGDMNADEGTIRLMQKAGCIGLAFGVETINPIALLYAGKSWSTPRLATQFTKMLRRHSIYSVATYTLGLLKENVKTLQETVDFAFQLDTDALQFSIATPFPGTPFYKICEENGYLRTRDWTMYDGARNSVVDYPQLSHEDIEEAWKGAMARRAIEKRGFRK